MPIGRWRPSFSMLSSTTYYRCKFACKASSETARFAELLYLTLAKAAPSEALHRAFSDAIVSIVINPDTRCTTLVQAVRNVEDRLDNTLQALDNLDPDDIENMRQRRLDQMKRAAAQKQEWCRRGHGQYTEISGERAFFAEMKGEERMVCHFFRDNWPCKVSAWRAGDSERLSCPGTSRRSCHSRCALYHVGQVGSSML